MSRRLLVVDWIVLMASICLWRHYDVFGWCAPRLGNWLCRTWRNL